MEKRYTKAGVLSELNEWFGVGNYHDIMNELGGMKQMTFTGTTDTPLLGNSKHLISLVDFFEDNATDSELLTVDELESELEASDWEFLSHDNTYNYNGSLERALDFQAIQSIEENTVLAFFAIHTGVDVRAGYSKSVIVKFENEYDFQEFLSNSFDIGYFTFTQDGKEYRISFDGSATSEEQRVYISNADNEEYAGDYSQESYIELDVDDVAEYLQENEIPFDDGSIVDTDL